MKYTFVVNETQTRASSVTIEADSEEKARWMAEVWADAVTEDRNAMGNATRSIVGWRTGFWLAEGPPEVLLSVTEGP